MVRIMVSLRCANVVLILCGVSLFSGVARGDENPTAADVRHAIERGLPWVGKRGQSWLDDSGCVSCHATSFSVWSYNEAATHGISFQKDVPDSLTKDCIKKFMASRIWFKISDDAEKKLAIDGLDAKSLASLKPLKKDGFKTEAELIKKLTAALPADVLAAHKGGIVQAATLPKGGELSGGGIWTLISMFNAHMVEPSSEFSQSGIDALRRWQNANGSWDASGQFPSQNRPIKESDLITTGWGILALLELDQADPNVKSMLGKAEAYFKKTEMGKNHEDLLVHLMVASKLHESDRMAKLLEEVKSRQNSDGGWSWNPGNVSDAYATGQTLYALGSISAAVDTNIARRAQAYLRKTQNQDGYWEIEPKLIEEPKADETRLRSVARVYKHWGSAWALNGLSRSLTLVEPPTQTRAE